MSFDYGLGDAQYQYDRQEPPDPFVEDDDESADES